MAGMVCRLYPDISMDEIIEYSKDSGCIYRVHIMRALIEHGYDTKIYGELYRKLFSKPDSRCLVSVEYLDMFEAAKAAKRSGGVVALAHPDVYDSMPAAVLLAKAGLIDAMEVYYPRRTSSLSSHMDFVDEYGLIATGGTDFHGYYTPNPHNIGCCCVDETAVDKIMELSKRRK